MKILGSIGLLIVLGLLILKLALAPLYDRYTAHECSEAYANAQTLADSIRVDMHPFASPRGGSNPRCGETRAVPASLGDIVFHHAPGGTP
jgi:hypothetical protein